MTRADLLKRLGLGDEARYEYDQVARDADSSVGGAAGRGRGASGRRARVPGHPAGPAGGRARRAGGRAGLPSPVSRGERGGAGGRGQGAGTRARLRRGADPAGIAVRSWRHVGGGRTRADAGHAGAGDHGRAEPRPSRVGPGAALAAGREPRDRNGAPGGAGRPVRRAVRVLAAYNAGISRVERWAAKNGMDDVEMFAERIPFVETRDYVRIVQRNRDLYRVLYGW